jgi:spore coat polysaccharide biosynthesis protein SpsF (cytidylyltransferase family)
MKKKVVAIVQARMGSSRLSGKSMLLVTNRPLIELVCTRVSRSTTVDEVILATTLGVEDDILEEWATNFGIRTFRGETDDVLSRFAAAALYSQADIVVRITADDPLKDPAIIDSLVTRVLERPDIEYASNTEIPSFPEGLDVEVFSANSLFWANSQATLRSDREHVTPFIKRETPDRKKYDLQSEKGYSNLRWTVDYIEDLEFVRKVFENFAPDTYFGWQKVIDLLELDPSISKINAGIAPRNQGYSKSLSEEQDK